MDSIIDIINLRFDKIIFTKCKDINILDENNDYITYQCYMALLDVNTSDFVVAILLLDINERSKENIRISDVEWRSFQIRKYSSANYLMKTLGKVCPDILDFEPQDFGSSKMMRKVEDLELKKVSTKFYSKTYVFNDDDVGMFTFTLYTMDPKDQLPSFRLGNNLSNKISLIPSLETLNFCIQKN